jgi:hypothetical protein
MPLPVEKCRRMMDVVERLEEIGDIHQLTDLLTG